MLTEIAKPQRRMFENVSRILNDEMPANMRGVHRVSALEDIVLNEGIPLAHVPRVAIVWELLDSPDKETRRAVLANRASEVIEDCLTVLIEPLDDASDNAIREVALKAAQSLTAGHAEAAQALAVLTSEQYISDNLGRAYAKATDAVKGFIADENCWFIIYYNAYLPLFIVPSLYTPWRPTDGTPPPNALSRHVTVHQVTADHLNLINAVIAVMQISGIVAAARWIQDFAKEH